MSNKANGSPLFESCVPHFVLETKAIQGVPAHSPPNKILLRRQWSCRPSAADKMRPGGCREGQLQGQLLRELPKVGISPHMGLPANLDQNPVPMCLGTHLHLSAGPSRLVCFLHQKCEIFCHHIHLGNARSISSGFSPKTDGHAHWAGPSSGS